MTVQEQIENNLLKYDFSPAERAVADLILQGMKNKKAAEILFVSENTIKFHLTSIFKKTGTKQRAEFICLIKDSVSPKTIFGTDLPFQYKTKQDIVKIKAALSNISNTVAKIEKALEPA